MVKTQELNERCEELLHSPLLRIQSPQTYLSVILLRFQFTQLIARTTGIVAAATADVRHICHVAACYAT